MHQGPMGVTQRRTDAGPGPWPRSTAPGVCRPGGPVVADSQQPKPVDPAEALERLGRMSLRAVSRDSLLQTVAGLAKTALPGTPEASVTMLVRDRPTTVASAGPLATDLDET